MNKNFEKLEKESDRLKLLGEGGGAEDPLRVDQRAAEQASTAVQEEHVPAPLRRLGVGAADEATPARRVRGGGRAATVGRVDL